MLVEAPITCTNCEHEFLGTYYIIVDSQHSPEACEQLLAGELNIVTCPACGASAGIDDLLLYHDAAAKILIIAQPEATTDAMAIETAMQVLYKRVLAQDYLNHPLLVIGQVALRALVPWVTELSALEKLSSAEIVEHLLKHPSSSALGHGIVMWAWGRFKGGDADLAFHWFKIGRELANAWRNPSVHADVDFRTAMLYEYLKDYKNASVWTI